MLALATVLFALIATSASANQYTSMLAPGSTSVVNSSGVGVAAGTTFASHTWSAPAGVTFGGFGYSSATFGSSNNDATGGLSVGFTGSGTSAPNGDDLNFPYVQDCSITEHDAPRAWVATGGAAGLTSPANNACAHTDGTGGTYINDEVDSASGAAVGNYTFQTLVLRGWCARDAACSSIDTAGSTVNALWGVFNDPYNAPNNSLLYWVNGVSPSSWYQTGQSAPSMAFNAIDPGGVCYLAVRLTGASTVTGSDLVAAPPTAASGSMLSGSQPCDTAENYGYQLPAGLASGAYSVGLLAANPGNYEAQSMSGSGSPSITQTPLSIHVDDTTPSVSWTNTSSSWTAQTSENLDVTAGPSGVASVTCTDDGNAVAASLLSGSTNGAGTSLWSVPTAVTGANAVSCVAANGDTNGALTGTSSATFNVDAVVPTVSFADPGYAAGSWKNSTQTVTVSATGGPSGITGVNCSVDGTNAQVDGLGRVIVAGDGHHTLDCTATSTTGVVGENAYSVNIDSEQPTISFLVDSQAPSSAWLSGTPVLEVIGNEQGGLLSGLSQITCSVNGGSAFALSGIDAATDYAGSFELQQNGADVVSCTGTTVAGTTQTTATKITVNVDNPNYSPDSSALIDNGGDPYSDGPSQSQWYETPQSVTITANDTGGSAPIAAISCKGAATGSWPLSAQNTDAHGGEQITVTVQAPGGDLSCTTQDAAGNVYALGSYLFQIDNTPPTGYFVPQTSWPEPDEVEIHATDNGGSGVAVVRVYGQSGSVDQGQPQLVGDAHYDQATGDYEVAVPDGIAPWVAGNWKFYSNVIDAAGNQGQVNSSRDGSTEDLTLPLRQNTTVSASVQNVSASPEAAIPTALAAAASLRPITAAVPARTAHVETATATPTAAATATTARAAGRAKPRARVVTVAYGRAVRITGILKNLKRGGTPISRARILVYEVVTGTRAYKKLGSVRTTALGTYSYRVRAGASRTLYVVYPGTQRLRSAVSDLRELSTGRLSVNASSISAGGKLVITGAVQGGHIPAGGVNVTIDYRQAHAPGSGTLGSVRTDSSGRYRFVQHFAANTKGLVYELWAAIPANQPKWPYLKASTQKLVRRIL